MKKIILIFLISIFSIPFNGNAQGLYLDTCVMYAERNFKYNEQSLAYIQSQELAIKDVGKSWLPKMVLDGSASFQNEQIKIPADIPIPGFTGLSAPLNFNRLVVNFSQTIYDGSVTASQKKLQSSKYAMHISQLETEKMELKSKVIGLFMGILLANENLELLTSKQKIITERHKALKGAEKYGGASAVNVKLLEAEMLNIEQLIIEATFLRSALVTNLGDIMGFVLPEDQEFIRPTPDVVYDKNVDNRPEIRLLTMQMENLELQKEMMGTSHLPRINAFGTLGIGNPGYDVFKEDLAPMGLIGIRLQWNFLDWGYSNNEKQILTINQKVVQHQQDRARIQFKTELNNQQSEIMKYENLLKRDEKLVQLREDVSKIKAAELDNGTITTTDYLVELDAEDEAKLNQKMHELRLVMAKLNYLTAQGN